MINSLQHDNFTISYKLFLITHNLYSQLHTEFNGAKWNKCLLTSAVGSSGRRIAPSNDFPQTDTEIA